MVGKLLCLIGGAIGGAIGWAFAGKELKRLKKENDSLDAKLTELRQAECDLMKEIESQQSRTDEEIQKTLELLRQLQELNGIDPTNIDIQIDPE